MSEATLSREFKHWMAAILAIVIAYAILSFFHVVFGELVPKGAALGHAEGTALSVAIPVRTFIVVFRPAIWLLQKASDAILHTFGLEPPGAEREVHSEAELRMLVSRSTQQGQIEEGERDLIEKVFVFGDKDVADVMVAKPDVAAVSIDMPPEEALAVVLDSPYTRYPVYRESLDDIAGVLHVRDLFSAIHDRGLADVDLEGLLRPAYVIPETKDLASLLQEFRRTNSHFAVVVDEYGAMVGIATLEDLLEEIVGEIEDEFDLPDETIEQVDDDTIRIGGTFPIDDFNERFRRRTSTPSPGSSSASSGERRSRATTSPTTGCASTCSRWRETGSSGSRSRSTSVPSHVVTPLRTTSRKTRSSSRPGQSQTVSITGTGWMFTDRSTPEPELTNACGTFAGATTMSPALASMVSSPTVNVA